jgi:hypothetical protein
MQTGPKVRGGGAKNDGLVQFERVSDIVTLDTDSRVCIRVKILSTIPSVADSAGTKL